jgi:hypothetical protein
MFWVLDHLAEDQDYCTFEEVLEKTDYTDEELNQLADLEIGMTLKLDEGRIEVVRQE